LRVWVVFDWKIRTNLIIEEATGTSLYSKSKSVFGVLCPPRTDIIIVIQILAMGNFVNLMLNKQHTCPWWLCFIFDNRLRKVIHNPFKILSPYIKKGDSVLDLGPGMGYFTIPLCEMVGDDGIVYAVDVQSEMLERITQKAKRHNIVNLRTHLIDNNIDIKTTVDFILAFWMFHEVSDKANILRQLHDNLKNNGSLLIVEPKIHVTKIRFENEISLVQAAGFEMRTCPEIAVSRAALFKKKDGAGLSVSNYEGKRKPQGCPGG
jgi:2-polyprenyl-3-methyl-5-hydroxy-6-metoxy-1,4-benzoquinol methylase